MYRQVKGPSGFVSFLGGPSLFGGADAVTQRRGFGPLVSPPRCPGFTSSWITRWDHHAGPVLGSVVACASSNMSRPERSRVGCWMDGPEVLLGPACRKISIRLRTIAPHTFACRSRWLRVPLRDWSVPKNAGSTTSASELNILSRTKLSFGWLMTAKQPFMAAFAIRSISDSFILIPSWAGAGHRRQHPGWSLGGCVTFFSPRGLETRACYALLWTTTKITIERRPRSDYASWDSPPDGGTLLATGQ
jgi:hypothetical protein